MARYKVAVIGGDGIRPAVVADALRVGSAAGRGRVAGHSAPAHDRYVRT